MEVLTEKKYYTYHTQNLVPTKLKINSEIFVKEISKFNFIPWGDVHLEFPRYAVPLINEDGIFKENDSKNLKPLTFLAVHQKYQILSPVSSIESYLKENR